MLRVSLGRFKKQTRRTEFHAERQLAQFSNSSNCLKVGESGERGGFELRLIFAVRKRLHHEPWWWRWSPSPLKRPVDAFFFFFYLCFCYTDISDISNLEQSSSCADWSDTKKLEITTESKTNRQRRDERYKSPILFVTVSFKAGNRYDSSSVFFFYLLAPLPRTNTDGVIGIKQRICLAERLHLTGLSSWNLHF